jgi:DNA repair ATPase RecN
MISSIYAKSFGIVIMDNKKLNLDNSLKSQIKTLFAAQDINYAGSNSVDVFIDRDKKIKKIYTSQGVEKLIEYAQNKKYDSIALVEYKKGSKFLSVLVVVADKEVQDRKSKLTAFHQKLSRELAKSILNSVLTLNYELGVLNVKNIY